MRRVVIESLENRLLLTAGELIVNGGFETGATGWTATGSWQPGLNNTSFTTYHGGSRYAFYGNASTGGTVNNSSGSLFQEVAIPASYSAPTLTFWSRTSTSETTTTAQNDTMIVSVQPAGGGAPIQTLVTISNLNGLGVTGGPFTNTGKYTPYEFALPPSLAGQTVRINFAVSTNGSLGTTFRIDDVGVSEPVPVTPGTSGQVVGYIRDGKFAFFDQLELSHLTWTNYFSLSAGGTGALSGTLSHLDGFVADAHALGIGVSITIVGGSGLATLSASGSARQTFATNVKNYILAHDLDGVDIDWEPKPTGVEAYNFGLLIDDLYAQLHPLGKKITAATFPNSRKDLPVAATKLMDWVNVMCYNFHFDNHATLADTIDGMNTWVNYGVARDKLVMGVPFYAAYGTSWSNRTTPTYGAVIEEYKTLYGSYPSPSIDSFVNSVGATVYFSGVTTTAAKMQHIRDEGFAGAMMWEPTQDHFDADKQYTPLSLLPILGEIKPLAYGFRDIAVVTPTAGGGPVSIGYAGANVIVTQGAGSVTLFGIDSVIFHGKGGGDVLNLNIDTTLHFHGNGGSDTINVAADVTFASDAGAEGNATAVNVLSGASVTFATSQHLTALNVDGGAIASLAPGGDRLLVVGSLDIDATGRLDLADNHLLVDYTGESPYALVKAYADAGRQTGTSGIVSAAAPAGDMLLAVSDNVHLGATTFGDVPIDDSTIVCRYTYVGDANMDGQVTTDDYLAVDLHLGRSSPQWVHGDVDLNGAVTTDDYVVIDLNLGKGTAQAAATAEATAVATTADTVEAAAGVTYPLRKKHRRGAGRAAK